MTYLDINCSYCGSFHHNGHPKLTWCPRCKSPMFIAVPHDFEIDQRFKAERQRTEDDN
jgi:rRNA maturation protein Nop10